MAERKKLELVLSSGEKLTMSYTYLSEEDIDLDRVLRIDAVNIYAELITLPAFMNQIGLQMAGMMKKVNLAKLNLEVKEGELDDKYRSEHRKDTSRELSNEKTLAKIRMDKSWKVLKIQHINAIADYEAISSIYWSLKSKDDKLNKLSTNIHAGDIEAYLADRHTRRFNGISLKFKANEPDEVEEE